MSPQRRPLLAATIIGLLAIPAIRAGGPAGSFAWGAPLVALLGVWLADQLRQSRKGAELSIYLLALLLLLPPAGVRLWCDRIALLDANWINTAFPLGPLLALARSATPGPALLLLGAAITLLALEGRRGAAVAGACFGGALSLWIATLLLDAMDQALLLGLPGRAARQGLMLPLLTALPFSGASFGFVAQQRLPRIRDGLLVLLLTSATAWIAATPLGPLLAALETRETEVRIATTEPGPGVSGLLLDPTEGPLAPQLEAAGHRKDTRSDWVCHPTRAKSWGAITRSTVAVAWPGAAVTASLDPLIDLLLDHLIHRLALLGRAPRLLGPLGPALAWPALRLNLDRPPAGAVAVPLPDGPFPAIAEVCTLLPSPELPVQELYTLARHLSAAEGGPCQALSLLPPEQRVPAAEISSITCLE